MGQILDPYRFAVVRYRFFKWYDISPGATPQIAEVQILIASVDQIPTMTGATTSGVTISEDSFFAAGQEGWRAGAKDGTTAFWGSNAGGSGAYLKVDFGAGNEKHPDQYSVQASTNASFRPTAWTFAGSNDDSSYTALDTQTGLSFGSGEVKTFTLAAY